MNTIRYTPHAFGLAGSAFGLMLAFIATGCGDSPSGSIPQANAQSSAPTTTPGNTATPTAISAQQQAPDGKLGSEVFDYIFDPTAADRFARNLAQQQQQQSQYDQFLFPQETVVPDAGMQGYRGQSAGGYLERLQRSMGQTGAAANGVLWPIE